MTRLELRKVKRVQNIELADTPLTIGRASSCDIVLDDTHVSRRHCVIELRNETPYVRDLKSHGGTYLNGKRITEAGLTPGDRVAIGPFDLVFKAGSSASRATSSADTDFGLLASDDSSGGTSLSLSASNGQDVARTPAIIHREKAFGSASTEPAPRLAEPDQAAADLSRRAAELDAREAQLDARQQRQDQENEGRVAELLEQISALENARSRLDEAHQAAVAHGREVDEQLEQARRSIAELHAQLADQATLAETLTLAKMEVQDQLAAQQARAKREADELRSELATAHREVERLRVHEQSLQEQVDAIEASRRIATERAEGSSRTLSLMSGQIQALDEAARRVASLQTRLAQIEAAWVQVDQQIQEAGEDDADVLESAATQQQEISAELDALNQLRDEAVNRLSESAQQLQTMVQHSTRVMAASVPSARALSVGPQRAEKRWWKFGH